MKRNSGGNQSLTGNYEKALSKIDGLIIENEKLWRENSSYSSSIENYKSQLVSLERAKNREIEELYQKLESQYRYGEHDRSRFND